MGAPAGGARPGPPRRGRRAPPRCAPWSTSRAARRRGLARRRAHRAGAAPYRGETSLFITPGFDFRVVDALITNFHLPRTSLLALVMAFCGVEQTRRLYAHAVRERYRFYSFGDAMLAL